ncbi:hypothetical protein AMECASPLE_028804, partial [Ameca splendens]
FHCPTPVYVHIKFFKKKGMGSLGEEITVGKRATARNTGLLVNVLLDSCSGFGPDETQQMTWLSDDIIINDYGKYTLDNKQLGFCTSPLLQLSFQKRTLDHWATVPSCFSLAQLTQQFNLFSMSWIRHCWVVLEALTQVPE